AGPADRLFPSLPPGSVGGHQAHRGARRTSGADHPLRETAAMIAISREVMAPLMFSGLIVFMLIGYPVAFSLSAVGLLFGIIGIEQGFFQTTFLQALGDRRS